MSEVVIEQDLRHRFGAPRDQGSRPTCLAFAVSDTHAAVRGDVWQPLSCEYLYYHAVRRAGAGPDDGATPSAILAAIEHDGQPVETGWPYLDMSPTDPALWTPPADIGDVFRRGGEAAGNSFDDAWALVTSGRPAVIGMTISDAFYLPHEGIVDNIEQVDAVRRHAVVAVASGRRGHSRFLLVRNSWGRQWGAAGHAWLAEGYLASRVVRVLALKDGAAEGT